MLNILGSETRREILQMLTERRCYVSQISEELNIGQKAIIKHLEIMEEAGLLEPHFERIEKGRPRKYFNVTQNLMMEVNLFSTLFDVKLHSNQEEKPVLHDFPRLKELALMLTERTATAEDIHNVREELLAEKERLVEAKNAVDFLINEANIRLEDEKRRERIRESLY